MNRKTNSLLAALLASTLLLSGCTEDSSKEQTKEKESKGATIPEGDRTEPIVTEAPGEPGEPVGASKLSKEQRALLADLEKLKKAFGGAKKSDNSSGELSAESVEAAAAPSSKGPSTMGFLKGVKLQEGTQFSWNLENGKLVDLMVSDTTATLLYKNSPLLKGVYLLSPLRDAEASKLWKDTEAVFNAMDKYLNEEKKVPDLWFTEGNYVIKHGYFNPDSTSPAVEVPRTEGVFLSGFTVTENNYNVGLYFPEAEEYAIFNSDDFYLFTVHPVEG